jgi:hypothetical protein
LTVAAARRIVSPMSFPEGTIRRHTFCAFACAIVALPAAHAQTAAVSGQVVLRDDGQPLAYTTISVLPQATQRLTSDSGTFLLLNLPAGAVRLRFKRLGFAPKDTVLTVAANDTVHVRIQMTRIAIDLPAVVVSGRCTNETPFETRPAYLAELFDQVKQNAERLKLLAQAKPFVMQTAQVGGYRNPDEPFAPIRLDTADRAPLPVVTYEPKRVARRGEGRYRGSWVIMMPELPDFADTAFTNNHCFHYAGQTRFEGDSVIAVDFEPVPWLDKEVDIKGTIYLRVDGYQLVGLSARLNRLPRDNRRILEYTHRTLFREVVPGIPVPIEWELKNVYRSGSLPFIATGHVIDIRWTDSTNVKVDSLFSSP